MKLPKDFPLVINDAEVIFVARPKCSSMTMDVDTKIISSIEYYVLGQHLKNRIIGLFSLDKHINVVACEFHATVELAMSTLEPDGLTRKDWKCLEKERGTLLTY